MQISSKEKNLLVFPAAKVLKILMLSSTPIEENSKYKPQRLLAGCSLRHTQVVEKFAQECDNKGF